VRCEWDEEHLDELINVIRFKNTDGNTYADLRISGIEVDNNLAVTEIIQLLKWQYINILITNFPLKTPLYKILNCALLKWLLKNNYDYLFHFYSL